MAATPPIMPGVGRCLAIAGPGQKPIPQTLAPASKGGAERIGVWGAHCGAALAHAGATISNTYRALTHAGAALWRKRWRNDINGLRVALAQSRSGSLQFFRRYTNLASTIDMLSAKRFTLLDPARWDDQNDREGMRLYKERSQAKSLLAACFAQCEETYHHWRVFSGGADGVCINFKKDKFLDHFESDDEQAYFGHTSVNYFYVKEYEELAPLPNHDLWQIKRKPYEGESEYHLIYEDYRYNVTSKSVTIDMNVINRIILSPWLHPSLVKSLKKTLRSIEGCKDLKIFRSTLISNPSWISAAQEEEDLEADADH